MKIFTVIVASLISSIAAAQTVTQADHTAALNWLKTHTEAFNSSVKPMPVTKSIYAIRDSLSKANVSSDLVVLEFTGSEFKQDKLFFLNIDARMNKKDIPFIKYKIVKKKNSIMLISLEGNNSL
jgi:hypothetical protein